MYQPQGGGRGQKILLLSKFLLKTAWKWRKFSLEGGRSEARPIHFPMRTDILSTRSQIKGFFSKKEKNSEFSFNEFRESDKSLKHELNSINRSGLSYVSCWRYCSILVSNTRGGRLDNDNDKYSVKTWEKLQLDKTKQQVMWLFTLPSRHR